MTPVIIGISLGLILILLFNILQQFDKKVIYGLILSGIGFLYVGYTWMDLQALIINSARLFSSCSLTPRRVSRRGLCGNRNPMLFYYL